MKGKLIYIKINVPQNMRLLRAITYTHFYSLKLLNGNYIRFKRSFLSLKLLHLKLPRLSCSTSQFSILRFCLLIPYYVSSYSSLLSGLDGLILIDSVLLSSVFVILSHISWTLRNYTLAISSS